MIRNLMALPCLLAFVLACGQGRTDGQDTGAAGSGAESGALPADTGYAGGGIEDTTAAPSIDVTDTAAPAGDTALGADTANQDQSGVIDTQSGASELGGDTLGTTGEDPTSDPTQ